MFQSINKGRVIKLFITAGESHSRSDNRRTHAQSDFPPNILIHNPHRPKGSIQKPCLKHKMLYMKVILCEYHLEMKIPSNTEFACESNR